MKPSLLILLEAETFNWVGVVIPSIVMLISFLASWWLYRHFSKGDDA